jgi:hypothetical protein
MYTKFCEGRMLNINDAKTKTAMFKKGRKPRRDKNGGWVEKT